MKSLKNAVLRHNFIETQFYPNDFVEKGCKTVQLIQIVYFYLRGRKNCSTLKESCTRPLRTLTTALGLVEFSNKTEYHSVQQCPEPQGTLKNPKDPLRRLKNPFKCQRTLRNSKNPQGYLSKPQP